MQFFSNKTKFLIRAIFIIPSVDYLQIRSCFITKCIQLFIIYIECIIHKLHDY